MVTLPVEHAGKYDKFSMNSSKGVLFYGPPGCGKTLLAKAVANECKANFISVKGPELLTKWFGESEDNVRQIFHKAKLAQPCVIFLDEIDSIAQERGSGSGGNNVGDRVVNALLTEMDGVEKKKNVFIIAATNNPWGLDSALCRPGRLDQAILIPMPDEPARRGVFGAALRKTPVAKDVNLDYLAYKTDGYSCADITLVCQTATKEAISQSIQHDAEMKKAGIIDAEGNVVEGREAEYKDAVPELTREHFSFAMEQSKKSITPEQNARFENWLKDQATQEVGQIYGNDVLDKLITIDPQGHKKILWPPKKPAMVGNYQVSEEDIFG